MIVMTNKTCPFQIQHKKWLKWNSVHWTISPTFKWYVMLTNYFLIAILSNSAAYTTFSHTKSRFSFKSRFPCCYTAFRHIVSRKISVLVVSEYLIETHVQLRCCQILPGRVRVSVYRPKCRHVHQSRSQNLSDIYNKVFLCI